MNYDEHSILDMRLRVLQLLSGVSGYDLNDAVIRSALVRYGHRPSADALRTELAWLAEQGCVTIDNLPTGTLTALLTERGEDAGRGRTIIPGIRRPAAGER